MRIAVADVLGWRPVRPTGRFLTTFPNWPRTIFEPAWRMRPTVRGGLSLPRYEAFVRPKPQLHDVTPTLSWSSGTTTPRHVSKST